MSKILVSVRDVKAGFYDGCFLVRSRAEAVRGFVDEVNNPQSMLGRHPEDYTLFVVGEFDEETGVITPTPSPEALGVGSNFIRTE